MTQPNIFRYGSERYTHGWYWVVEGDRDPVGPFQSEAEARADYEAKEKSK